MSNHPSSQFAPLADYLGRIAAQASRRHADQFADLKALARLLESATDLHQGESGDHGKVASVIARLSGEYANLARADADLFDVATDPDRVAQAEAMPPYASSHTPRKRKVARTAGVASAVIPTSD